jgi:hypothetical protein
MPSRRITIRIHLSLLAGLAALLCAGCAQKKVQATAPAPPPASQARPMTVAPDTDAAPPVETADVPPEIPPATPKEALEIAPVPVVPPPRRVTERGPAENAEEDNAAHTQPPKIAPELSPSDQAAKQKQVEDDSAVATRNLQRVNNAQLSANQKDLVDHIREALNEASNAGKSGDWIRAQNRAHVARSLSEALVDSL